MTYPDLHNLSGSALPIQICITYPDLRNLSASAAVERDTAQPALQARTCGGIHERARARKRPKQ